MQRLEVSCAVRLIYTSLGAKGLISNSKTIFEMFINLIWIFTQELRVVYNSEFARRSVKRVFTLLILAQYSSWWGHNEGTASREWRHANVSLLGLGVWGTGSEQTGPASLVFAHLLVQMPHESILSTATFVVLPIYVYPTIWHLHSQRRLPRNCCSSG